MKLILSTDYIDVYYREDLNILYAEWSKKAKSMDREEFKKHIIDFVAYISEYSTKYGLLGFLTNSQKGHFTMDIDIQAWHDEVIAPQYLAYRIEKIGFVLPKEDFFAAISLQQTFEEAQAQQLQTRFFSNLEDALAWMK